MWRGGGSERGEEKERRGRGRGVGSEEFTRILNST